MEKTESNNLLVEPFYTNNRIDRAIHNLINNLKDIGTPQANAHANLWTSYLNTVMNKKYLSKKRTTFNEITTLLDARYLNSEFTYEFDARRKAVESLLRKCLSTQLAGKSLDSIRDQLGFRLVLDNIQINEQELLKECYNSMQVIIEHLIGKGYTLCDADQVTANNLPADIKNCIVLPNNSTLSWIADHFEYHYGIKDYIRFPKETGYQSLHAYFRDQSGAFLEIQVRTNDMDDWADDEDHDEYKKRKYKDISCSLDPLKIKMPSYRAYTKKDKKTDEEKMAIKDKIGIFKARQVYHRGSTH